MPPNPTSSKGWGRWLVILPCIYFIFATFELTPVHEKLGPLGVFGVDFFTPFVCILAFFPMLGLLGFGHWRCGNSSPFRSRVYALTSLCLLAIIGTNLAKSPGYQDEGPFNDFCTIVAAGMKTLIAPPGYDKSTRDDTDFIPSDAQSVTVALEVSVMLLGLAVWDFAWPRLVKHRQPAPLTSSG
jgi:hypothetical protein